MNPAMMANIQIFEEQGKGAGVGGNPMTLQRRRKVGAVSGVDPRQVFAVLKGEAAENQLLAKTAGLVLHRMEHQGSII